MNILSSYRIYREYTGGVANVATNIGAMDRLHLHLVLHNVLCSYGSNKFPRYIRDIFKIHAKWYSMECFLLTPLQMKYYVYQLCHT